MHGRVSKRDSWDLYHYSESSQTPAVWDSLPAIPDSRGFRVWDSLRGIPWDPPVDSRIPSLGRGFRVWDSLPAGWDPLGSQTPVDSESGIPQQFNSSQAAVATAVELTLFTSQLSRSRRPNFKTQD